MPADPLNIIQANQDTCVLTCKEWKHVGNQIICNHNGQTIQHNALTGECPHPRGSRFAPQERRQLPPPQAAFSWAIAGPLLWKELHVWALTAKLSPDGIGVDVGAADVWLRDFTARITCGECKDHWRMMINRMPPDFSSRDKLFEWTWRMHQNVNERLGKLALSLDDARRIWTAAAVKPVIVTKGCGGCGG